MRKHQLLSRFKAGEQWRSWGILLLLSLIWGTSYILIKRGLEVFSPIEVASLRLGVSAVAFAPLVWRHSRRVRRRHLGWLLVVGLTGTMLPSFLFPAAQREVTSSVAGILNSLTPLFTLLLGMVFFGARFSGNKSLGILIGLGGALLLFAFGERAGMGGNLWYGGFIILACLCYATSSNVVGFHLRDLRSLTISALSFFMVGAPALVFLLFGTDFLHTMAHHPRAWVGLGYVSVLALFSTVLASIIFFQLIQWTSPVFGSTVSYLVPAVALLWGAWDGEVIHPAHFLGMGLILIGITLSRG